MDSLTLLKKQLSNLRELSGNALAGLTDETINWVPSGTANSIGVNLLHMVGGEDYFINVLVRKQEMVWNAQWAQTVGVPIPPGGSPETWTQAKAAHLPLESLLAYIQAVWQAREAYLAQLSNDDLDQSVDLFGQPGTLADLLSMTISHSSTHLGEISVIKGLQGLTGWPY